MQHGPPAGQVSTPARELRGGAAAAVRQKHESPDRRPGLKAFSKRPKSNTATPGYADRDGGSRLRMRMWIAVPGAYPQKM